MLAAAVAHHLDQLGLVDWRPDSDGGDCFVAYMPDQPPEVVGIFPTGGAPQSTRGSYDLPRLQIRTRGDRYDPVAPHDRLVSIHAELACLDQVLLAEGTDHEVWVAGITPLQSAPVSIGRDDVERPEFTQNWQLQIHAPTVHRPVTA